VGYRIYVGTRAGLRFANSTNRVPVEQAT